MYVLDSIYLGKPPIPVITQALIKLGVQQTHYQDLYNYIWVAFILRVMPETDTYSLSPDISPTHTPSIENIIIPREIQKYQ